MEIYYFNYFFEFKEGSGSFFLNEHTINFLENCVLRQICYVDALEIIVKISMNSSYRDELIPLIQQPGDVLLHLVSILAEETPETYAIGLVLDFASLVLEGKGNTTGSIIQNSSPIHQSKLN
jgi:hypothetical protein